MDLCKLLKPYVVGSFVNREFKIRRLRTTNYGWTSVFVCLEHWVESCKYRTLRFHYRRQTTRGGGEGNNTQKFSCFHHSSQKCKSVLHVILSLEQWTNSSILEGSNYVQVDSRTSWFAYKFTPCSITVARVKLVNKVLVAQVLFFSPMNTYAKY